MKKIDLSKIEIVDLGYNDAIRKDEIDGILAGTVKYDGEEKYAVFYGDYDFFWDAGCLQGLALTNIQSIEIDDEEVEFDDFGEAYDNLLNKLAA